MRTSARRSSRFHARITDAWSASVRDRCPEIAGRAPFLPVVVTPAPDASTRRVVDGFLDWWSRASVPERQSSFRGRVLWSPAAFPYEVGAGAAHTAHLLRDVAHRPGLAPAVWLAAFLLQTQGERGVPAVWTAPQPRQLLDDILELCLEVLYANGLPPWHLKTTGPLPGARDAALSLRHIGASPTTPDTAVATVQVALRLLLAERTFVRLVVADPATGLRSLDRG